MGTEKRPLIFNGRDNRQIEDLLELPVFSSICAAIRRPFGLLVGIGIYMAQVDPDEVKPIPCDGPQ